jgi:hypothetical protein
MIGDVLKELYGKNKDKKTDQTTEESGEMVKRAEASDGEAAVEPVNEMEEDAIDRSN